MHDVPSQSQAYNPADTSSVLMAAFAAAAVGALLYNVLPLFLGGLQESKRLTSGQTGLLGTAFFLGFNLTGLSAFLWIRRWSWRTMALGSVPVILLMLALSVKLESFTVLALLTVACGAIFGVPYTIGSVMVGDTSEPERWYGAKVGLESLLGALIVVIVPAMLSDYGFQGVAIGMVVGILLLSPLFCYLPSARPKFIVPLVSGNMVRAVTNIPAVSCAVFALFTLFASISAIWAFAERMGNLSGFSAERIGALLGGTLMTGVAGSFVVAAIGSRVKPVRAFLAAAFCVSVSLACLVIKGNFLFYAIGNCLYMFGWAAGTPLAMAEIARLDHDGRYAALIAPAIGTGSMIGPGVAGWLLDHKSLSAVLIYSAGTLALSAAAIVVGAWLGKKAVPQGPAVP